MREPRKIVIQPNLAAWLRAYPLSEYPIVLPDFQEQRAALGKKFGLIHDVLRHTFISMFVGKYRSLGEAALQAGNSESIIRKHYLDLKSTAEADDFFGILPTNKAALKSDPSTSTASHLGNEYGKTRSAARPPVRYQSPTFTFAIPPRTGASFNSFVVRSIRQKRGA